MGKKAKKKARAPLKEKQSVSHTKTVSQPPSRTDDTIEESVEAVKKKRSCVHFNKAIDLDKVLVKLKKSEPVKCAECKEGVHERRGSKGKGNRQEKKKARASLDPSSETKAIWVCLECGHYACAGVGLPTGAQTHMVRHIRQTHHRLVIQWENPHLRWCFPCSSLLPVEKKVENGESKDLLSGVVKLIKEKSSNSSADTEDFWSGSGSVSSEIKSESTVSNGIDASDGYLVRGLVNLGNTCFFNSVMQNLLALDQLREHFLNEDVCGVGSLNCSLKKLFAETKPEAGLKNVINPTSFFGCVCSKAPQFRGYQQHDSHELLRCLLDGLSTEELSLRRKLGAPDSDGNPVNQRPTLIDSVFGGEISSTVSCMECGHSSKVYEPFLDLSLPVPTKKTPPKKPQTIARAKKTKLPPKRVARTRTKVNKDTDSTTPNAVSEQLGSSFAGKAVASLDDSTTSACVASTSGSNGISPVSETSVATILGKEQASKNTSQEKPEIVFDSTWMDILGPETIQDEMGLDLQDNNIFLATATGNDPVTKNPLEAPLPFSEQAFENARESLVDDNDMPCWLAYLGPGTIQDENDLASQSNGVSFISESINVGVNGIPMESNQVNSVGAEPDLGHSSSSVNPWEEELSLQVQDSQVLYIPYKEESSSAREMERGEAEASSSVLDGGQQELDFDGFGDLFNEPEISEGPISGSSSRAEAAEAGFMAVKSSGSDQDEIDDMDSPVSIESCLTHFIKPEILSNDNAWNCENCSKNLKLQRLKEKKQTKIALRTGKLSGGETSNNSASLVSHYRKSDSSNRNCINLENGQMGEPSPESSNCNEEKNELESMVETLSNSCGANELNATEEPTIKNQESDSQLAESSESEGSEDGVIDSENVTVKRDATKKVVINKAPPILTIHLKRFSQDARGRLSKLNGHIIFKEFIHLRQYMDARCDDGEQHIYRLSGVVEHSGTMRGGHYIAYVRGGHQRRHNSGKENHNSMWYYASDSHVRQVSFEQVLRCEAYILFYERI